MYILTTINDFTSNRSNRHEHIFHSTASHLEQVNSWMVLPCHVCFSFNVTSRLIDKLNQSVASCNLGSAYTTARWRAPALRSHNQ
jgi:hypothetical protein